MADEKTFTKADIDAAVTAAVAKVQESVDKLEAKNAEILEEKKAAERKLRAASEIKPEDLTAAEERADNAEAQIKELQKAVKDATTAREKAEKALEAETGAARNYALDAEIAAGIAEGGIVPALAGAYRALLKEQKPEVELVDGKYVSKISGKPVREYISEDLSGENGKHFKAAANNHGGGANGGKGGEGGKKATQAEIDAMRPKDRATFFSDGGSIAEAA